MRDTPISEQAILGAAMGAAMTGLRPIAEIMFADFFAVCWDIVANEIAKSALHDQRAGERSRSSSGPATAAGCGSARSTRSRSRTGRWRFPGSRSWRRRTPADVIGLFAAAVRDPDPVMFFEHKSLYASKGEVPDGEIVDKLGTAKVLRDGGDATIVALAAMVPRALAAAERLPARGIECDGRRRPQPGAARHPDDPS